MAALLVVAFVRQLVMVVATPPYLEQLNTLRELIESGKVRPLIEHTYDFGDVGAAIRRGATENTLGKLVIRVG